MLCVQGSAVNLSVANWQRNYIVRCKSRADNYSVCVCVSVYVLCVIRWWFEGEWRDEILARSCYRDLIKTNPRGWPAHVCCVCPHWGLERYKPAITIACYCVTFSKHLTNSILRRGSKYSVVWVKWDNDRGLAGWYYLVSVMNYLLSGQMELGGWSLVWLDFYTGDIKM